MNNVKKHITSNETENFNNRSNQFLNELTDLSYKYNIMISKNINGLVILTEMDKNDIDKYWQGYEVNDGTGELNF